MRHFVLSRRLDSALCLFLGVVLCCWAFAAQALTPVPPAGHRVTDLTRTLTPAQVQQLADRLQAVQHDTGAQIAVLLLDTTAGEDIAAYALRVGEAWKLGKKGADNGVVFVVAKGDRKVRIEVGYGLEGALSDVVAKRILREQVSPKLKEGQWFAGLLAGIDAMASVVRKEAKAAPPAPTPASAPAAVVAAKVTAVTALVVASLIALPLLLWWLLHIFVIHPATLKREREAEMARRRRQQEEWAQELRRQRETYARQPAPYTPPPLPLARQGAAATAVAAAAAYTASRPQPKPAPVHADDRPSHSSYSAPVPARNNDDDDDRRSSPPSTSNESSGGGGDFGGAGASDSF